MVKITFEHFCPYCNLWIEATCHRPGHHNDPDALDEHRDDRIRVTDPEEEGPIIYEAEEEMPQRLRLALPW